MKVSLGLVFSPGTSSGLVSVAAATAVRLQAQLVSLLSNESHVALLYDWALALDWMVKVTF